MSYSYYSTTLFFLWACRLQLFQHKQNGTTKGICHITHFLLKSQMDNLQHLSDKHSINMLGFALFFLMLFVLPLFVFCPSFFSEFSIDLDCNLAGSPDLDLANLQLIFVSLIESVKSLAALSVSFIGCDGRLADFAD